MLHYNPELFFILGCQRTGTTLMRLILESHSDIFCVDESRAYSILSNNALLETEISKNKQKKWLGFKVPRITEQMLEPFLADYGINFRTPNNYKRKPIIFMIRNVFDTITSMRNRIENGHSWIEEWPKATIDFWTSTNPYFTKLYKRELNILKSVKDKDIVSAAIYWKYKTSAYFNYENSSVPIIKVHYEDLVTDSKKTIGKVLNFLNIKWEDTVMSHEKIPHVETDEYGYTVGNTDVKSPITNSSVNKYKKHLTTDEITQIVQIAKDLMIKLNYKIAENA